MSLAIRQRYTNAYTNEQGVFARSVSYDTSQNIDIFGSVSKGIDMNVASRPGLEYCLASVGRSGWLPFAVRARAFAESSRTIKWVGECVRVLLRAAWMCVFVGAGTHI